jgi:hypothetical protein
MKIYKPKEEFQQAINIQNAYVELLKNYHKELNLKIKGSKGFQLAKYQVEIFEVATKLDEQISLLREKINHFDNNFIEQYDKELKECEENFENILQNSNKILNENYKQWINYLYEEKLSYINYIKDKNKSFIDDLDEEIGTELQVQKSIVKSKESILTIISLQDRAKSLLETKKNQIKFYIEDWRKLELKDRNNIEVKNVLYKDLRNLVTFPQI